MSNITPINDALMQPIHFQGQVYFTSQYFHRQYRNNSGADGGKYKDLKNFNALVRSLETYNEYISLADIVELMRDEAGLELQPAFKATFGKPIMLINATAQIALTHHLDDEISKQISVNANASVAKQMPIAGTLSSLTRNVKARIQLANVFGLKGNEAILAANEWTKRDDGVNVLGELGIKVLIDDHQSKEVTGTMVGNALGIPGNGSGVAQNLNLLLWDLEYLSTTTHKGTKVWVISEKGLKSEHLKYGNVEKENGQRSSVQTIIYRESLVDALSSVDINGVDYKGLKQKRKEAAA